MISPGHILLISAILFCIGLVGMLLRRNALAVVLGAGLMFNAAALNIASFSRIHGELSGELFALFALVFAALQVAVGLAIVIALHRTRGDVNLDRVDELKW